MWLTITNFTWAQSIGKWKQNIIQVLSKGMTLFVFPESVNLASLLIILCAYLVKIVKFISLYLRKNR